MSDYVIDVGEWEGGTSDTRHRGISPSSASRDRILKRRRYQRAGIAEYWLVDPDARLVERWRPADERPEIIIATLRWLPDGSTSELAVETAPIFAAIADED